MSKQTVAPRRPHRSKGGAAAKDYAARMARLELQVQLLMEERYGQVSDRARYEGLCDQAKAIGGELTKTFAFDEDGRISAASRSTRATYRRPYWLTRKGDDPRTEIVAYDLPRQFVELELVLMHDERVYRETTTSLAYAKEPSVMKLMGQPDFEAGLQALARKAGGSLELKVWSGKTYVYYYRYKRLKTATVFSSLLKHSPYHTSGKHRYTFWLPVDYVLLRKLLKADAEIYAALPAEVKRPGYP